ncbi:MAG: glycosyltransferase family 2 protein [Bacteroidales bacterium]|nr:glycosyltransferase family 2 protein [Bacteroidales bacterium]
MKNTPLISVITVVYNGEKHIGRTVQSVMDQTYRQIEYIIVDGESTDHTLEVIAGFKGVDRVISEPDQGLYDAMNKGLKVASGDYVWFLNAGDQIYQNDTVEKMFRGLDGLPDIIYGGTMIIDEKQNEIGDRRLKPPGRLTWRSFRQGMVVCHQSILVKRELAPMYNLDYRFSADIDWAIRSVRSSARIHNTSLILSRFLEGGLTEHHIKAGLKERFKIMKQYYGLIPTILRHFIFGVRLTNYYLRHRRI